MKQRVLLINPTTHNVYDKSKVKGQVHPPLSLATIATPLLDDGHTVKIIDLIVYSEDIKKVISEFNPNYIGITFTTPQYNNFKEICKLIKKINNEIIIVAGGVHATAQTKQVLDESEVDILALSEADFVFPEIIKSKNLREVKGIAFKENKEIILTLPSEKTMNLDNLPIHLFDLKKYKTPKSFGLSPLGAIETSRGCPFRCIYCNKNIFGHNFRTKSIKRVIDEFKYLKEIGFKEVVIEDDCFTFNMGRAKSICDMLIKEKVNLRWTLWNGIRVDCVDLEFLKKAKRAGCYRVHFGVESANQKILNRIKKGINIEQVKRAVKLTKKAGVISIVYFMFGFPGETEESMQEAIDLAIELNPDFARVSIVIPYPRTDLWKEWNEKKIIKSHDWSKYIFHNVKVDIYEHPTLNMELIYSYYEKFYRKFYYRPTYFIKRIFKGIARGTVFSDISYFLENFIKKKSIKIGEKQKECEEVKCDYTI